MRKARVTELRRRGFERAQIHICFKHNIKDINLYKTVKPSTIYLTLTTWTTLNSKVKDLTTNALKLSYSEVYKIELFKVGS